MFIFIIDPDQSEKNGMVFGLVSLLPSIVLFEDKIAGEVMDIVHVRSIYFLSEGASDPILPSFPYPPDSI